MNDAAKQTWILTVTANKSWVATVTIQSATEEEADAACIALLRLYSQRRGMDVMVEPRRAALTE